MEFTTPAGRIVELREDDITRVAADAIVNAPNSALAGGGGVDDAGYLCRFRPALKAAPDPSASGPR